MNCIRRTKKAKRKQKRGLDCYPKESRSLTSFRSAEQSLLGQSNLVFCFLFLFFYQKLSISILDIIFCSDRVYFRN